MSMETNRRPQCVTFFAHDNLLSVRKITSKGFKVNFEKETCKIISGNRQIGIAHCRGDLFRLRQPQKVLSEQQHQYLSSINGTDGQPKKQHKLENAVKSPKEVKNHVDWRQEITDEMSSLKSKFKTKTNWTLFSTTSQSPQSQVKRLKGLKQYLDQNSNSMLGRSRTVSQDRSHPKQSRNLMYK